LQQLPQLKAKGNATPSCDIASSTVNHDKKLGDLTPAGTAGLPSPHWGKVSGLLAQLTVATTVLAVNAVLARH